MAPALSPAALQVLLGKMKEGFALILVGFILATTLYGISLLQTFLYYMNYSDRLWLKLTVAGLIITDTLSTALVSHAVYTYMVTNLGDLMANTRTIWSFRLENGILQVTTIIAQGFYAHQIWKVSRNRFICTIVVFLALATFGLGIKETVYIFQHPVASAVSEKEVIVVGGIIQGFAALCDIIITATLVYYLRENRDQVMKNTRSTLDKIILNAISRGTVTAVFQLLFMILNVSFHDHIYWNPFHQMVGKLYVNSVLSTLNMRNSLRISQRGGASSSSGAAYTIPASATFGGTHTGDSGQVKFAAAPGVHITSQKTTLRDFDDGTNYIELERKTGAI